MYTYRGNNSKRLKESDSNGQNLALPILSITPDLAIYLALSYMARPQVLPYIWPCHMNLCPGLAIRVGSTAARDWP